jgi:ATP-dependent helicase HrpB
MTYPVEAVLGALLTGLAATPNAVLIAPPGAGKTTMVAPAILRQDWCTGQVLLLSPRRIAARMAAERIAELCGEDVGNATGYATRMDSKQSASTRLLVLTEGIFRSRIIADPELSGVSAILFDEVHERSLDSDFGLALALEAQAAFRPDLRIVAMSATLDGDRFSALMDGAPVIQSEGKSWPLTHRYAGRRAELPIEHDTARVIKQALAQQDGDILAFLPGAREIARTAELLESLGPDIAVHALHGSLDPAAQRAALRPDPNGRRKVILATNIAETSLTIDGVRIVIDSGLARRARYDIAAGVTRLVTERASLSAATQRAGRAARQGPGTAYRLWEEAGNGGLPPFDPPEILESDLAALVLDCALWGEADPAKLRWLDTPPEASLAEARKSLITLAAIDESGRVTPHGTALAKLPLPPHLAHMVIAAAASGQAEQAATLALLLQERGLGGGDKNGQGDDLELRLERFAKERSNKAEAVRGMARRIAVMAGHKGNAAMISLEAISIGAMISLEAISIGAMIALAYPQRVAKRRDTKGENWISVMGRGLRLDPASLLVSAQWLAVADMQGAASGARITSAAAITGSEVEAMFAGQIQQTTDLSYDRITGRIDAKTRRKLGAITLSEGQAGKLDPVAVAEILVRAVTDMGLAALPWSDAAISLRQRAHFAGEACLSDESLLANTGDWLLPIVHGVTRLRDVPASALYQALENRMGWDSKQRTDRSAPPHFISPAGTSHDIDYAAEAGPTAVLRVQALFGLDTHPCAGAARVPLVLSLTSPAGRPIQTTRDLPAFWRGSWHDVAKEMRGRYPKHNWPEKPWEANASLKTKKAQMRT